MLQEIPNSHYWNTIASMSEWAKAMAFSTEKMSKTHILEHLIVGLDNMAKNGYAIVKAEKVEAGKKDLPVVAYNSSRGCPKCGYLDGKCRYISESNTVARACGRCEYKWSELALDSVPEIDVPFSGKYAKPEMPIPIRPTLDCAGISGDGKGKTSTREG